jgi:ribonucleoside-diphosphate reductase subunit M1
MKVMYEHVNGRNGKWSPLVADDVYEIIKAVRARNVGAGFRP